MTLYTIKAVQTDDADNTQQAIYYFICADYFGNKSLRETWFLLLKLRQIMPQVSANFQRSKTIEMLNSWMLSPQAFSKRWEVDTQICGQWNLVHTNKSDLNWYLGVKEFRIFVFENLFDSKYQQYIFDILYMIHRHWFC